MPEDRRADDEVVCGPDGEPVRLGLVIAEESDGFVGHAVGVRGAVVAQGQTFGGCMRDLRSALSFHLATFGMAGLASEVSQRVDPSPDRKATEVNVLCGPSGLRIKDTFVTLCGSVSPEDAEEMLKAIGEDCERIEWGTWGAKVDASPEE